MAESFAFAIETLEIERSKHRATERECHRLMNETPCKELADGEIEESAIVKELDDAIRLLRTATEVTRG